MKSTFFLFKHQIDGEIRLEADEQRVYFTCRWPFDLSNDNWDEWTDITNTFAFGKYRSSIMRLAKGKEVTIRGIHGGHLSLKVLGKNKIEMIVAEKNSNSNTEFTITLTASAEELLPKNILQCRE